MTQPTRPTAAETASAETTGRQPTRRRKQVRRPTVEELLALSPEDFEAWWRSMGGKTASDLGVRVE